MKPQITAPCGVRRQDGALHPLPVVRRIPLPPRPLPSPSPLLISTIPSPSSLLLRLPAATAVSTPKSRLKPLISRFFTPIHAQEITPEPFPPRCSRATIAQAQQRCAAKKNSGGEPPSAARCTLETQLIDLIPAAAALKLNDDGVTCASPGARWCFPSVNRPCLSGRPFPAHREAKENPAQQDKRE